MSFTTSAVGTGQPKVVYGKVIGLDGHPKADELIILTATKSQTLLAQTDHQGYWQLNLGNMKPDTGDPYTIEDEVHLSVMGDNNVHRLKIEDMPIQQMKTHY